MHAALGLSAPTGSVTETYRRTHQEERGFLHYEMQLGSGTWDLLPSLTWNARFRRLFFGAQLGGVLRLEAANEAGYALGDRIRVEAWGGAELTPWLRDIYRDRRDKTIFLIGDGSLRYGDVVAVIDAAKAAGLEKVGVVTEGMRASTKDPGGRPAPRTPGS